MHDRLLLLLLDGDVELFVLGVSPAHAPDIGLHLAGPLPRVRLHVGPVHRDLALVAGVVAHELDPGGQAVCAVLPHDGVLARLPLKVAMAPLKLKKETKCVAITIPMHYGRKPCKTAVADISRATDTMQCICVNMFT